MDNVSATIQLTELLIARQSLTPADESCQDIIADRLVKCGFSIENMPFGSVSNLWARLGNQSPLLVFLGHTDVVPAGPEELWTSPPFEPTIRDGYLYGRGAADMKSGLAAMVTATERFLQKSGNWNGSIAFLVTSDEEGQAVDGTVRVIDELEKRGEKIDWCIVGEPSSVNTVGDTIKNGRRGSLTGKLTIKGQQGHVAYPQLAVNPIHLAAPVISELCCYTWDSGNQNFPPTSLQFSNIKAGTGADNVIPAELEAVFNLRFSSELTPESIYATFDRIMKKHNLEYKVKWHLSGMPFFTPPGQLVDAVVAAVRAVTGDGPRLSTAGGTSDGRFVAPTGAQVVEVGVVNSTIHKINECVSVAEIDKLSHIYEVALNNLLVAP